MAKELIDLPRKVLAYGDQAGGLWGRGTETCVWQIWGNGSCHLLYIKKTSSSVFSGSPENRGSLVPWAWRPLPKKPILNPSILKYILSPSRVGGTARGYLEELWTAWWQRLPFPAFRKVNLWVLSISCSAWTTVGVSWVFNASMAHKGV